MAITKGTGTASSGANTTGFTVVINSGVQANDILVIGITNRDATANPTCVDNEGAGTWARITTVNAATNGSLSIWWKRASANTASKTITVGSCTGSASGYVLPFRGASLSTTPFGTPVGEPNASADEAQAGITTARDGSMVIHLIGCTSNDTLAPGNRTATTPSTLTESGEGTSTGGSDCSMSFASDVRSTAGATGNISWAQTDGTGASLAIELLPAWTPLTATSGAVAITGTAATLKVGRVVSAGSGAESITGTAVTLRKNVPITAASGSVVIAGTAAGLRATRKVTASSGSTAIAGTAAALKRTLKVTATSGSESITGTNATLTYTPNAVGYTLTADSGSVSIAGTAAAVKTGHRVAASAGAASISGTAAGLRATRKISAASDSASISGTAASLRAARTATASTGAIDLSGTAAGLRVAYLVSADAGSLATYGAGADFIYEGSPGPVLLCEPGTVEIAGDGPRMFYMNRTGPKKPREREDQHRFGGGTQRSSSGFGSRVRRN